MIKIKQIGTITGRAKARLGPSPDSDEFILYASLYLKVIVPSFSLTQVPKLDQYGEKS